MDEELGTVYPRIVGMRQYLVPRGVYVGMGPRPAWERPRDNLLHVLEFALRLMRDPQLVAWLSEPPEGYWWPEPGPYAPLSNDHTGTSEGDQRWANRMAKAWEQPHRLFPYSQGIHNREPDEAHPLIIELVYLLFHNSEPDNADPKYETKLPTIDGFVAYSDSLDRFLANGPPTRWPYWAQGRKKVPIDLREIIEFSLIFSAQISRFETSKIIKGEKGENKNKTLKRINKERLERVLQMASHDHSETPKPLLPLPAGPTKDFESLIADLARRIQTIEKSAPGNRSLAKPGDPKSKFSWSKLCSALLPAYLSHEPPGPTTSEVRDIRFRATNWVALRLPADATLILKRTVTGRLVHALGLYYGDTSTDEKIAGNVRKWTTKEVRDSGSN